MPVIPDQAWWDYYVTLDRNTVIYLTSKDSAGYDPVFDQKLGIAFSQRMFGFANYSGPAAGSNNFPGAGEGWIGPTRS